MYKRILSFMLILCLCMGMAGNTRVYAMGFPEDVSSGDSEVLLTAEEGQEGERSLPEERQPDTLQDVSSGDLEMFFVTEEGGKEERGLSEESELDIPQNGSKVYMEAAAEAQPAAYSLQRAEGTASMKRYIVLVLDTSSSVSFQYNNGNIYTADAALPYVKKAAKKFINDMGDELQNSYIAIVDYGGANAYVAAPFMNDKKKLLKAVESLKESGTRNVHSGLTTAEGLIDSVSAPNATKDVVLFTTGMTTAGRTSAKGHYDQSTFGGNWRFGGTQNAVPAYEYANPAYDEAQRLQEKCTVYSIGLFNVFDDMPEKGRSILSFFKLCACDWASSKNHFYEVTNPNNLEFVFGQVADNILKRTGKFYYPGKGKDYTADYYYDDNYFKDSSYTYNPHLATMSLCLELSAWGSEKEKDYTRKMKNAEKLLNELGFVGFDHNYTDFTEEGINGKPTMDSVGVVAANKLVNFNGKEYTLIAVAVRGGGYEREWASNFTIGESGDHEGFSKARDIVIAFLENYIKEQELSGDIKIWITGYSRAAATANMVAGAIDNGAVDLGACNLELKDLFAYTFETPAGVVDESARDAKYNNIFNLINKNDPVPFVAPKVWGFTRYGTDRYLPCPELEGTEKYKDSKAAMLKQYKKLDGYDDYIVDDFKLIDISTDPSKSWTENMFDTKISTGSSQGVFLDYFVGILAKKHLKDRRNYVQNYQKEIRQICGIYFGTESAKTDKLFTYMMREIKDNDNWIQIIGKLKCGRKDEASEQIAECVETALKKAEIYNYTPATLEKAVAEIVDLLSEVAQKEEDSAATFLYNLSGIGQAHYPELCLAWMRSADTNYTTDVKTSFSSGKYRIVRVNFPVDVTVYDAEGNVLASIIDNIPRPDSRVVTVFNNEGEKLVYLPVYHDYVIKLAATDDGVMNYAVQEFDSYAGETNHMFLFNDIEITAGQEYTAYLPRYSETDVESQTGTAADTDYTLFLGSTQILCSEELANEEVFNAYYDVNATVDGDGKGIVFGSGMRQYGTFAKVMAAAFEGYEFVGWYEGENLVSTEAEYRFRVSKDTELAAVFKEASPKEKPEEKPEQKPEEKPEETPEKEPEKGDGENTGDNRKGTVEGVFKVISHWNTGFNAEITLTNTTDEVIHNWVVAFDLPYEIENVWNGNIASYENGVYTIQNAGYNWDIEPGESVTFGIYANAETETIIEPVYYTLIEKPARTVKQNYQMAYKVNSDWGTAFNGQIEIRNVSSEEIFDWTLEFDCDYNINQFWNAQIVSHKGNHYVIKNKGYNAVIGAGQTLVLGFEADSGNANREPIHYTLTTVDMKRMQ